MVGCAQIRTVQDCRQRIAGKDSSVSNNLHARNCLRRPTVARAGRDVTCAFQLGHNALAKSALTETTSRKDSCERARLMASCDLCFSCCKACSASRTDGVMSCHSSEPHQQRFPGGESAGSRSVLPRMNRLRDQQCISKVIAVKGIWLPSGGPVGYRWQKQ